MQSLYHTVVTKRELSQKAKLFVYRAIFVLTLNYGHEVWVMTERTRLRIQADKMSFLGPVAIISLTDRVRCSLIRERLRSATPSLASINSVSMKNTIFPYRSSIITEEPLQCIQMFPTVHNIVNFHLYCMVLKMYLDMFVTMVLPVL